VNTPTARSELDSMIVEIELTLVSIIQGVALYFLIESARSVLTTQPMMFWPYILAGLLVIFIFWSRSVLHIITVIRWPLEFGHNFLYIACAFLEALLFTRLGHPIEWFLFGTLFATVGWMLFVYDLRLIQARARDSAGPASNHLIAVVTRDQWLNIAALLPAVFMFNLACLACLHWWPGLFLSGKLHVYLAVAQVVGFGGYLLYVVRFFATVAPFVVTARAEWHAHAGDPRTKPL
jgi:hypothetical protein